jgi:hypothetical protein
MYVIRTNTIGYKYYRAKCGYASCLPDKKNSIMNAVKTNVIGTNVIRTNTIGTNTISRKVV